MSKPGTISAAVAPWKADRDAWKVRASRAEADLLEAREVLREAVDMLTTDEVYDPWPVVARAQLLLARIESEKGT